MSEKICTTNRADLGELIDMLQSFPENTPLSTGPLFVRRTVSKLKDADLKEYKFKFTFTVREKGGH